MPNRIASLVLLSLLAAPAWAKKDKPAACSIAVCPDAGRPCPAPKAYQVGIQPGLTIQDMQDTINILSALYREHEDIRRDEKCAETYREAIHQLHTAIKAESDPKL